MSVRVTSKGPRELPEFRAVCSGCGAEGLPVEGRPLKRGRPDLQDPAFHLARQLSGFHEIMKPLQGRRRGVELHEFCAACVCSKCGRAPATACRLCGVRLCEHCGEQHDPPDCPPQWKAYMQAVSGQTVETQP